MRLSLATLRLADLPRAAALRGEAPELRAGQQEQLEQLLALQRLRPRPRGCDSVQDAQATQFRKATDSVWLRRLGSQYLLDFEEVCDLHSITS